MTRIAVGIRREAGDFARASPPRLSECFPKSTGDLLGRARTRSGARRSWPRWPTRGCR